MATQEESTIEYFPPRIGVFVCYCGTNIAGSVDCERVAAVSRTLPNVVFVQTNRYTCSDPGQAEIEQAIKEHKLNRIVVASCSPKLHETTFQRNIERAGLNKYVFEMANIREHDSWVHKDRSVATPKAEDLVRMAVAKARLLEPLPEQEVTVSKAAFTLAKDQVASVDKNSGLLVTRGGQKIHLPPTATLEEFDGKVRINYSRPGALVIGGGVAGIQAALDLAEQNYRVFLVEKTTTIGGVMALLDKTFPTLDCSICILGPKMADVGRYENIELISFAELEKMSGYVGNFKLQVNKKPRFINETECNGCRKCEEVCPVEVTDHTFEFDTPLGTRKAIYCPYPQAIPLVVEIDHDACIGCGLCFEACDREGAIVFNQIPDEYVIDVGAIIVATGYKQFDPMTKNLYGINDYANIITGPQMERMINASGPTEGHIVRPSDHQEPKRVAFIQCVGSRDVNTNPYCSSFCCNYTSKQIHLLREHVPGVEVYVYYMDIRSWGEFESFYKSTRDMGVKYIRGLPVDVYEVPETKNLIIEAEDTLRNELREVEVDQIVLITGAEPAEGTKRLSQILKITLGENGFFAPAHIKLRPVDATVDGIFLAGCASTPRDISDSVASASAAVTRAANILSKETTTVSSIVAQVSEELCDACRTCVGVCPYDAISIDRTIKKAVVNVVLCKGCGACASYCPTGAIDVQGFTDAQIMAQIRAALEPETLISGERRVIMFCCNWCSYGGADAAGLGRKAYPPNIRIVRTMCSARVNPVFVLEAFMLGADGVLVSGCHPGDCQYVDGNYKCERNYEALYKAAIDAGIEPERIRLEWISASEGIRFQKIVTEFVQQIEGLEPNPLKGTRLLEYQQEKKATAELGAEGSSGR